MVVSTFAVWPWTVLQGPFWHQNKLLTSSQALKMTSVRQESQLPFEAWWCSICMSGRDSISILDLALCSQYMRYLSAYTSFQAQVVSLKTNTAAPVLCAKISPFAWKAVSRIFSLTCWEATGTHWWMLCDCWLCALFNAFQPLWNHVASSWAHVFV